MINKNPLLLLHIAVFLFGFTAIIGKLLSLDAYSLVWWRMFISSLVFLVFPGFIKKLKSFSLKQILIFMSIGILVAAHWVTFYGSIKAANSVSLTLACFGLTASFTSVIEPIVLRQKLRKGELFLGAIAFIGLYCIYLSAPHMEAPPNQVYLAILLGVVSSFLAALFSSLNALYIKEVHPVPVTFLELLGGAIILALFFGLVPSLELSAISHASDLMWLLILTVVCTNLAFVLNLYALKKVSAFTANIAINLEPIYGIILAVIIFGENQNLNTWFYVGALIILATVFAHPVMNRISRKRQSRLNQDAAL